MKPITKAGIALRVRLSPHGLMNSGQLAVAPAATTPSAGTAKPAKGWGHPPKPVA